MTQLSSHRTRTAWGFLLPALLLVALSVLIPAAMALVMRERTTIGPRSRGAVGANSNEGTA